MSCIGWGLQYVGQTKRTIAEHFTDLKYICFNSAGHHITKDMRITVISLIKEHPDSKQAQRARDKMEMFWYHQLVTLVPRGFNREKILRYPTNQSIPKPSVKTLFTPGRIGSWSQNH